MTRFLFGFLIGAVGSAAIVIFTAPRSGNAQREQLKSLWDGAKEAAREAEADASQQMWADYRLRAGQA